MIMKMAHVLKLSGESKDYKDNTTDIFLIEYQLLYIKC